MSESSGEAVFGAPGTGIIQLLPIFVREGVQLESLGFSMLPWGAPGLSTAAGLTASVPQEQLVLLAYEWPAPWLRTTTRLTKSDLEWLHLHRFSTDHRLAFGLAPFAAATRGDDPPDYRVATDDGPVAVDCTAFTVEVRRGAHALFVNLRRRVAALDPVVLGPLTGYMV